jgi:hypothetical protein
MQDLAHISQEIKNLVAEIKAHPLSTEDTRRSYLELTLNVFNAYYIQWNTVLAARIIAGKQFSVTEEEQNTLSIFNKSITDLNFLYTRRNGAYRGLFIESWSTFEFCLTYLCDFLFSDEVKKELLEQDLNEIKRVLASYSLSEAHMQKVVKMFYRDHLTHVPITRKYNKLYSQFREHYIGDWIEDSSFLEFFGKYRNTMHTNYIYHGKDKSYTFLGITYYFENGKAVSQSVDPNINNTFDLAVKLKNTCKRLFDAIQHPELIPFPSDQVQQY